MHLRYTAWLVLSLMTATLAACNKVTAPNQVISETAPVAQSGSVAQSAALAQSGAVVQSGAIAQSGPIAQSETPSRLIRRIRTLSPIASRPHSRTMHPMNYSKYRPHAGCTRFKGGIGSSARVSWIAVAGAVMRCFSTAVRFLIAIMPIRQTTVALNLMLYSNKCEVSACRRCNKAAGVRSCA
jgi:hypothetical protein